jgi:hypothetical protein
MPEELVRISSSQQRACWAGTQWRLDAMGSAPACMATPRVALAPALAARQRDR